MIDKRVFVLLIWAREKGNEITNSGTRVKSTLSVTYKNERERERPPFNVYVMLERHGSIWFVLVCEKPLSFHLLASIYLTVWVCSAPFCSVLASSVRCEITVKSPAYCVVQVGFYWERNSLFVSAVSLSSPIC